MLKKKKKHPLYFFFQASRKLYASNLAKIHKLNLQMAEHVAPSSSFMKEIKLLQTVTLSLYFPADYARASRSAIIVIINS